jgi:hypothetical protein
MIPKRILLSPAQIKQRNAFALNSGNYTALIETAIVTTPAKLILYFG